MTTLTLAATACLLTGCASNPPTRAEASGSVTAESADTEQLDLLAALTTAVPASRGEATVNRFRTCSTESGEDGVQITREIRGHGVSDPPAAVRAFRSVLVEGGFDAEVRRRTKIVGTGDGDRFAAFNADRTASIIQAYSACYPFDLESNVPTVPPTPAH